MTKYEIKLMKKLERKYRKFKASRVRKIKIGQRQSNRKIGRPSKMSGGTRLSIQNIVKNYKEDPKHYNMLNASRTYGVPYHILYYYCHKE